jgi:REP element-mobilizing transposase RayT
MGRPLRIEYPGALYHVTSRGNEKRRIFLQDSDRLWFLRILEDYHDRYGILIHNYVLMDNHYHLVIETPRGNLLKVMHGLNGGYTGYFNRKHGRVGHLFQGRYTGILVDKDSYLLQLSRYLHLNPVVAKIVERPEQYKWSSYGGFIREGKQIGWVEYRWLLSQFGRDKKGARRRYKEFVEEGLRKKVEDPFKNVYGQVVLGGEEFREMIRGLLKGRNLTDGIVERQSFKEFPNAEDIIRAVARVFRVRVEALNGKRQRGNQARKVAVYLVKRYSGLDNGQVGQLFGGIHYSAVSKVAATLEQELATDQRLTKLVEGVKSQIKA